MFGVRDSVLLVCFAVGLIGCPEAAPANEPWQESAADPSSSEGSPAVPSKGQPAGSVRIDQLLKLPTSYRANDVHKGGATRIEWRARFEEARADLSEKEKNLARVRAELEKTAGDATSWKMAPPGADLSGENNPVSFRLTQELRRSREEVEHAEKRLTDLDIEASLAGVPDDWRL